jgi:hypothetical protein
MLTIIEGPDGSGKTRFAEWYADNCGYDYTEIDHHGSYPGIERTFDAYYSSIARATQVPPYGTAKTTFIVMDRAWLGELVYGPIRKNPSGNRIGTAGRRILERFAWSARAVVVLCMPPLSKCQDWFLAKPVTSDAFLQQHAKPDELLEVHGRTYNEYQRFVNGVYSCSLPLVTYDATHHTYEELRTVIASLRPHANGGPGIGAWKPGESLLIVSNGMPYANTAPKSEAARIANELEAFNVGENTLYWSKPIGSALWVQALNPPRVFAIGRASQDWCKRAKLSNVKNLPDTMGWHAKHAINAHPLASEASQA